MEFKSFRRGGGSPTNSERDRLLERSYVESHSGFDTHPAPVATRVVISSASDRAASYPTISTLEQQMLANGARYDQTIARALCAVSSWCYSEPDTFARMMTRQQLLDSECVSVSFANDALLVDNDAFILQSFDGRVAILAFRGTSPLNAITWLANASVRVDPFLQVGYVHGGFYRSVLALISQIEPLLEALISGRSIFDVAQELQGELRAQPPEKTP